MITLQFIHFQNIIIEMMNIKKPLLTTSILGVENSFEILLFFFQIKYVNEKLNLNVNNFLLKSFTTFDYNEFFLIIIMNNLSI